VTPTPAPVCCIVRIASICILPASSVYSGTPYASNIPPTMDMTSNEPTTQVPTSVVTQTPTNAAESTAPATVFITRTSDSPVETPSLMTFFTPPADCTDGLWTSSAVSFGTLICTRGYTSSCFPSSFLNLQFVAVFSPGVCPYGYNVGDTYIDTRRAGITSRMCCPGQVSIKFATAIPR
jgi:hypothetical protein